LRGDQDQHFLIVWLAGVRNKVGLAGWPRHSSRLTNDSY